MTALTGNLAIKVTNGRADVAARTVEHRNLAARLIAQAHELMAMAAELGTDDDAIDPAGELELIRALDETNWTHLARSQYRDRRLRSQLFDDASMFGEPAWDLLLDLFIAARERKRVPVTSACIGAAVPTTTALRWLTVLETQGLVLRENDASDARRVFVRLSTDAYARMAEYFRRSSQGQRFDTAIPPRGPGQNGFMFG
ncbi:MAG: MarR family transcriptional regulator [Novosphingobium sp.]